MPRGVHLARRLLKRLAARDDLTAMERVLVVLVPAIALLAVLPAQAPAHGTPARSAATADRNHDRIPDSWERRHRLSLRVKQTMRDQDRDGLANLAEYRAKTNPRDRDSDDDGLRDGAELPYGLSPRDRDSDDDGVGDRQENAGRVARVRNGVLTIALAAGGTISGAVTKSTVVRCRSARGSGRRRLAAAQDGTSGDEAPGYEVPTDYLPGDDMPEEDFLEEDDPDEETGDDEAPGRDAGDDDGEAPADDAPGGNVEMTVDCSAALIPGALVHESALGLARGVATFRRVELIQ